MRDIKKRVRDPKLDIIRIFALICVVGVHFFLNCGFYDVPIVGKRMYVASVVRAFFITCVPLFLMLTGYLVNKKQLTSPVLRSNAPSKQTTSLPNNNMRNNSLNKK